MLRSLLGLSFVFLAAGQMACASSTPAKVCNTTEESACTTTFTECTTKAADRAACLKCVDDYCSCYSACGNTCDKAKLTGTCPP